MSVHMEKKMEVTLKEVMTDKMNSLENHFIRNDHLKPEMRSTIEDQMAWIKKMWRIVSDDDREWIEMADVALEEQLPWK